MVVALLDHTASPEPQLDNHLDSILEAEQPQIMMLPPPCFTFELIFLRSGAFLYATRLATCYSETMKPLQRKVAKLMCFHLYSICFWTDEYLNPLNFSFMEISYSSF